jgi:glycosyltransferase involved in cell wall biosynthesis
LRFSHELRGHQDARIVHVDLLIVTPAFPANEQDDTCMPLVQNYLIALRERHPQLRIAAIATQYPFHHRPYTWNGIEAFPCDGRNQWIRKPLALWRASRYFRSMPRPKAIHALWLSDAALAAVRMTKRAHVPFVLTMLGQDARDNAAYWRVVKSARPTVVALSERQAVAFNAMSGIAPRAIIPFGYPGPPPPAGATPPSIDVLFCGSMYAVKDPMLFIRTIALVNKQRSVRAAMFGFGPQEEVREAIGSAGLNDVIDLRGGTTRNEVSGAMSNARILLHTARYEGQCYAFEEALAHGMSIVSTPVGSATASERWSIAKNAEDLASRVLDHLQRPRPRTPMIRFPVEDTVKAYMELYGI